MANFAEAAAALRSHLETNFVALPIRWPNDDRDATTDVAPDGFVYAENEVQDERQVCLGSPHRRRDFGEFRVVVYVPRGRKVGQAEAWAGAIRDLFTTTGIAEIVVTSKTIETGSYVDGPGGKWYAIPIRVQWYSDRFE